MQYVRRSPATRRYSDPWSGYYFTHMGGSLRVPVSNEVAHAIDTFTAFGKIERILVNAHTTAEQQKRSLAETNILKSGLEKTLERSDYIAKGMENSLASQQSVLRGNERILVELQIQ